MPKIMLAFENYATCNQDLKGIYRGGCANSRIHHFFRECIAFNRSTLRHENHMDFSGFCFALIYLCLTFTTLLNVDD